MNVSDTSRDETNKKGTAMSVASKPTAKLVIDGAWGNKSEDAASYAFNLDQAEVKNSSSSIKNIFTPDGWKKVQKWLNKYDLWKQLTLTGKSMYYPWFDSDLIVDGAFGVKSETALGGTIINLSAGNDANSLSIPMYDFEQAGRSIAAFQTLLNGIIFQSKPSGPGFEVNSSWTDINWHSSNKTWAKVPPSRYTS